MSKLQELIQKLCPDGVEWKKYYDVCDLIRGITYNKSQEAKTETEDAYKVLRANNITLYLNALNFDDVKLVSKDVVVKPEQHLYAGDILMCAGSGSKEHVGKVAYIFQNMDYTFGGFMAVVRCKKAVLPRYMFHILASHYFTSHLETQINSSTINNINRQVMQSFEIPVPPLEVQEEIVRILDNFTNLAAELQARQEQYEYYRNKLLTFNNVDRGGYASVTWMKMSEIGEICMCKRITKDQTNNIDGVPFYKISTFGKVADAYISRDLYEDYKSRFSFPRKGEILISASGTIGRTVVYDGKDAYFQDSNIVWIHNDEAKVLNRYLYHYYQIIEWNVEGGTIKRLYNNNLAKTKIAVPNLAEQKRIVSILDKFDALVNDLSRGLPAEIAAVQEQYEYYRNKLLSFPRTKISA